MGFSEKVTHSTISWKEPNKQQVLAAFQKYKKAAVAQSRDPVGECHEMGSGVRQRPNYVGVMAKSVHLTLSGGKPLQGF